LEKTIAFGDGENDVEMLTVCGHGVAMANARAGMYGCNFKNIHYNNIGLLRVVHASPLLPAHLTHLYIHRTPPIAY